MGRDRALGWELERSSGGWNDGGGFGTIELAFSLSLKMMTSAGRLDSCDGHVQIELTFSKPLPLKTLSVVAATFPPLRCKSHTMVLRSNCGNICITCSTCAMLTRRPPLDRVPLFPDGELKKNHRIAKNPITMTARSCGILSVCSGIGDDKYERQCP